MTEDAPIGLKEAIALVRNCDEEDLMSLMYNKQLIGFFDRLNKCGTDVLRDMGNDEANSSVKFVQISTVMQLLTVYMGDFQSTMEIMSLASSDVFEKAIILALKSGIGLCVTEELR